MSRRTSTAVGTFDIDASKPPQRRARGIEIMHAAVPGRTRLRVDGLRGNRGLRLALERAVRAVPWIETVSASEMTGTVLIVASERVSRRAVATLLTHVLRDRRVIPFSRKRTAVRVARSSRWLSTLRSRYRRHGPPTAAWHSLPVIETERVLGANGSGLTQAEATRRLRAYGGNVLAGAAPPSALQLILRQVNSLPVALLGAAAVVSLATGGVADAIVIAAVVAINAAVGYSTERHSERIIRGFTDLTRPMALVSRDGREIAVDAAHVVPGDVLILRQGTIVAADARLIDADRLTVDESSLTGESVPVQKSSDPVDVDAALADRTSMIYRSTLVTGGQGRALVAATGAHTEIGQLQRLVETVEGGASPMQMHLDALGRRLTVAALCVCAAVFTMGLLRGLPFIEVFKIAISLAVSAVPEGLPAVATTILALGVGRLRARGVVVKQLTALETLGSMQVLCLDKTGTLTENRMTVRSAWAAGRRLSHLEGALERLCRQGKRLPAPFGSLLRLGALCTEARIIDQRHRRFEGSPTEAALLDAAAAAGIDLAEEQRKAPVRRMLHRSEGQNFMTTVHARGARRVRLFITKGSPDEVLRLCTYQLTGRRRRRLGDIDRRRILQANEQMSSEALRVLGVAYARAAHQAGRGSYTWVGLVGMADRVRDDAPALLRRLRRAGIRMVMITGDQPTTAAAVARRIGLNVGEPMGIVEGSQVERLSIAELGRLAARAHVFARVSPAQKLKIVGAFQHAGLIVGMTGDGVNDGPALKAANLGIAVGESATEVAREIAGVVVCDGQLERLAAAVDEGRSVFVNVQRSIHFLLSTNSSETAVIAAGVAAGIRDVLTPRQLLWINLISDLWPSLALAVEPPAPGLMDRSPRPPTASVVSSRDAIRLAFDGATLAAGSLAAYAWAALRHGPGPRAGSRAFLALTGGQLLHAYNVRARSESSERNRHLDAAVGVSLLLQVCAAMSPAGRRLLGLMPLGALDLAAVAVGAAAPFALTRWNYRLSSATTS